MTTKRNIPWHTIIATVLLALIGLSETGYADTYNFSFGQKTKKHRVEDQEDVSDDEPEQEQKGDSVKSLRAGQPIIINNVNTNDNTNRNGSGKRPVKASTRGIESPSISETPSVAASLKPAPQPWPSWNLTLSAFGLEDYDYYYGGLMALGFAPTRSWDARAYVGASRTSHGAGWPIGGLEIGFSPYRISFAETWDLFRLGFVAGGFAPYKSDTSLYAGVRASVYLGPWIGVSATARLTGDEHSMLELGLTASL